MAKFLQIGDRAIKIEDIQVVRFFDVCEKPRVSITMAGARDDDRITFSGDNGEAFMRWWANHVEIHIAT